MDDAIQRYTAGVDRSPTEIAALFLEEHPDGDVGQFLVAGLGLSFDEAAEALQLLPAASTGADPAAPPAEPSEPSEPAKAGRGRKG